VTFEYFSKNCRQNSSFINIWQEKRVLYMKPTIYFWSYLAQFFLECEMFLTKVLEEIKTHFVFNNFFFFWKSCLFEIIWKIWWGGLGHRQQYCTFALHAGYLRLQKHTLMLCNTHSFFHYKYTNGCKNAPQCYMYVYIACLVTYWRWRLWWLLRSELWRRAVWYRGADVSKDPTVISCIPLWRWRQ